MQWQYWKVLWWSSLEQVEASKNLSVEDWNTIIQIGLNSCFYTIKAALPYFMLGRTGTPQEIARSVRYLIMDGDYITGQTLNINGGIYM